MDTASVFYLGITIGLCLAFAAIVLRTYGGRRKEKMEEPKHRMLEDD
jgi:hypothetical protein